MSVSPPLCKVIYSKGKEFAPKGSKFFPFRVDPLTEVNLNRGFFAFRVEAFSEGNLYVGKQKGHCKSYLP